MRSSVSQTREELEQAKAEHERMRSSSRQSRSHPHPLPPTPPLSSALGINLDPLCASARKQVEEQMATMVATIQNAVRSALEQQAKDTALHEGADAPDPAVAPKPADDVPMEPAPGSQKRMRESSPVRPPTPKSRTHSPQRSPTRSRSPSGKPQQAVKEKMADFGHRLAASIGKAAEATASAASPPAGAQSRRVTLTLKLRLTERATQRLGKHRGHALSRLPVQSSCLQFHSPGHPLIHNVHNVNISNVKNNIRITSEHRVSLVTPLF